MGTVTSPVNDSKGCGGVMRIAPIGLIAESGGRAFTFGCETAAITHGHPSGYYAAGSFAAIIRYLREGRSLSEAIDRTLRLLVTGTNKGHEECAEAIQRAVALWHDPGVSPTPEAVERLGAGWVAEEALAISLYCALHASEDFARGVLLAVNHSGDSDSTGALTGNLLGLMLGIEAIPSKWLRDLELRAEIEAVSRDLYTQYEESDTWSRRYPGW
jgi:ADP-ribosylglycohydrolase